MKAGPATAMKLIVTRPAAQATAWVQDLQALGLDAQALPLIDIAAAADLAPIQAAWQQLPGFALVMFVSANAVAHFFALAPHSAGWPVGVMAASTGPGTTAALHAAGVPPAAVVQPSPGSTRFDSEALWAQLSRQDWAGRSMLVVRGEEGRDWLADTLQGRGAQVQFVAAYQRHAPRPGAAGLALLAQALQAPRAHLWLFSSNQALGHLRGLAPAADWSRSRALASHPRIVQSARALGFGQVLECPPSPSAVAARWPSIQSLAS